MKFKFYNHTEEKNDKSIMWTICAQPPYISICKIDVRLYPNTLIRFISEKMYTCIIKRPICIGTSIGCFSYLPMGIFHGGSLEGPHVKINFRKRFLSEDLQLHFCWHFFIFTRLRKGKGDTRKNHFFKWSLYSKYRYVIYIYIY